MKLFIAFLILIGFSNCSQALAQTDNVKKFCLIMTIEDSLKKMHETIKIKNSRKIIVVKEIGGKKNGKKVIRIDKFSFDLFKNSLINETGFYSLPDSIFCQPCKNPVYISLSAKTKRGIKSIAGSIDNETNNNVQSILKLINYMAGYIGGGHLIK